MSQQKQSVETLSHAESGYLAPVEGTENVSAITGRLGQRHLTPISNHGQHRNMFLPRCSQSTHLVRLVRH
jgi:hypothetical protein